MKYLIMLLCLSVNCMELHEKSLEVEEGRISIHRLDITTPPNTPEPERKHDPESLEEYEQEECTKVKKALIGGGVTIVLAGIGCGVGLAVKYLGQAQ